MISKISLLALGLLFTGLTFGQSSGLKTTLLDKPTLDSVFVQKWNTYTEQWVSDSRYLYRYDDNGNIAEYLQDYYEETTKLWIPYDKQEFVFDEANRKIQYFSYHQIPTGLTPSYKMEYFYNTNDQLAEDFVYGWHDEYKQWEDSSSTKHEYTYDSIGHVTLRVTYGWDDAANKWIDNKQVEYSYNADGEKTRELSSYRKWNTEQWEYIEKWECSYNSEGNPEQAIRYFYDENTSEWLPKLKNEYAFESYRIQIISYTGDDSSGQWKIVGKSEYNYDANGNLIQLIIYEPDNTTGQLIASKKEEYTYDGYVRITEVTFPPFELILPPQKLFVPHYRTNVVNRPLTYSLYYWQEQNNDWLLYKKGTFCYSDKVVSSSIDINAAENKVYPNPVRKNLHFSISGQHKYVLFELYDVNGRKIFTKNVTDEEIVNLENLETGIYFYNLLLDGQKQHGKLIKI